MGGWKCAQNSIIVKSGNLKMKELIILFLILIFSLTACSTKVHDESAQTQSEKPQNTDVVLNEMEIEISEAEAGGANADAAWDFSEIHGSEEGFIVSAQDLYNDGGWGWFPCSKSGTYHFQAIGTEEDIYSPSAAHNLVWKVYLMEKPFTDTPRFIPQAGYEAVVTGDGSVKVEEGIYIVIYCSQNSYEYGLSSSYEGDSEAFYQCTME